MELRTIMGSAAVLLTSAVTSMSAHAQERRIELGIYHALECVIPGDLDVTVYIYNRGDTEQTYVGEVADEDGTLLLSGDWELTLEEVRNGEVVWSKQLSPEVHATGKQHALPARKDRLWKTRIPVSDFVEHPGNYRFRVCLGEHSQTGRVFRIVERRGVPEWISLMYVPDKKTYFIGEAITVHFTLKNNGADEFHFEEGGDYRGASRHLRWIFTAKSEHGNEAVDPRPSQPCFGGLGMADPHLKPGKSYEKDLPLLAYLRFLEPGRYQVKCYQSMGFGEPVRELDAEGSWGDYAFGNQFEIKLRLPTDEEASRLLRNMLTDSAEPQERRRRFASLYHPCFLQPLRKLLANESDIDRINALVGGVASVMTVASTRELIALARDDRAEVRLAAIRQLAWRLPDPRDTGAAKHDSPFRFYSPAGRIQDVKASWDESLREPVRKVFYAGLEASSLDEVSACAYAIGALGDTAAIDRLVAAADRVAPELPVASENAACANQIASTASLLAQLGAEPCAADKTSSPGRLAVWANMIRTKASYRTGEWEELILHMLHLDCPVTRMAAIRWLPRDFSKRDRIPWKQLFLEKDSQTWWHAIQIARQTFPPNLRSIAQEVLATTTDSHKQGEFKRLIEEIDQRSRK